MPFVCVRARAQSCSHVWLFATPWSVGHQTLLFMEFSRQITGVGWHFLLRGGSSPPRDQAHVSCPSCFGNCCLVTQLWQLFCESTDWGLPGKNTGVDCHFFSLGDLPNPGIKPESPALQVDSLPLSHWERHWALWLIFNYSIIHYIYIYHSPVSEGIQISRLDYKNISEIFFLSSLSAFYSF